MRLVEQWLGRVGGRLHGCQAISLLVVKSLSNWLDAI